MTVMSLGDAADAVLRKLQERRDQVDGFDVLENLDAASDADLIEMAAELTTRLRIRIDVQHETIVEAIDVIERLRERLMKGADR